MADSGNQTQLAPFPGACGRCSALRGWLWFAGMTLLYGHPRLAYGHKDVDGRNRAGGGEGGLDPPAK